MPHTYIILYKEGNRFKLRMPIIPNLDFQTGFGKFAQFDKKHGHNLGDRNQLAATAHRHGHTHSAISKFFVYKAPTLQFVLKSNR